MAFINMLFEIFLHSDKYLNVLLQTYGAWVYGILFLIIFLETGLVITPFLPGDSILFITGAFAAQGALNIFFLFFLLVAAAIIGDSVNYKIGNYFGEKVFSGSLFFRKEYMERTKKFYKIHGGKTIVLARFVPIVRTFAPFVAGVGKMNYLKFLGYNVFGAFLWIALFLFGGYYFGTIQFVKENLTLITLLIIFVSVLPVLWEWIKTWKIHDN